jgi:preprotein translocase subunit YajC
MNKRSRIGISGVLAIMLVALVVGGSTVTAQRDATGGFEGTVVQVWEDGLTLNLLSGGSMRVDTWDVCGDNTAQNIAAGDVITVYADRELASYDAWRILDADGQPACAVSASSTATGGGFAGTVVQVWEDGLRLNPDGRGSMRFDTWDVCGDNTARNIAVGDRITVYADHDLASYDAWRILDANGQPACDAVAATAAQRDATGGFEGTVGRVWEDGLTLNLDDGGSMRVDTWDVCGDNTARNITAGDVITVYADRDLASYDAWRILDADGQPVCAGSASSTATGGGFAGTVVQVWEDGLRLEPNGGRSMRVDTWDVCGDNTARNIAVGDEITVYADRSLFSYDAWRILDADGQPVCAG